MRLKRPRLAIALVVGPLLAYAIQRGASRGNDFKYPYGAARQVWQTGQLNMLTQVRYPVSLHVLMAPLGGLPIGVAAAIWTLVSALAIAALPRMLAKLSGIAPREQWPGWLLAAPFFADAIVLGQSDPINILLVTAGLAAAMGGRGAVGSSLVAVAGLIKILPFLQLGTIVFLRRSWDVWLGIALGVGVGLGVMAAAVGWEPTVREIQAQAAWYRDQEKPWHMVERGSDLRPNNESLPIVLARTFGDIPATRLDRRTVVLTHVKLAWVWRAWMAIVGVLSVGWLVGGWHAQRLRPERGWLAMFALSSILLLATTPICWNHYFLWTLPAALFLIERRRLIVALAGVSLLITASQSARSLGGHMWLAIGMFAAVVIQLRREAIATTVTPPALADDL